MGKLKKLFLIIASFAAVFAFAIIGVNSVPTSVVNIGGVLNYSSNFIFTIIDSNTVSVKARVNTISGDIEIPSQVTISNHQYSVVTIDANGFKNCSNITELKVPSTITSIGSSAFDGCSNMTDVTIDSSYVYNNLTSISALGNLVANADTINLKTSADNGTNSFLNNNYIKSNVISGYNTYSFAYLITIPSGDGYELQNSNNTTFTTTKVRPGDSISFKVAIQTGYTQSTPVVKSNGTVLTPTSGLYTISNIQENKVLTVEGVAKNTYTLTFPANVTVTKNGTPLVTGATITHFDTLIISYTETTGYHKTSFKVNGVEKTSGVSISVTGDVTITYAEEINKYTITFAVNNASYGTTSRASQAEVPYGSTISVSGNAVTINGVSTTATPTAITGYTTTFVDWTNATGTITDVRTITANFSRTAHTYTVQYNTWNGTAVATSSHTYDTAKNLTTYAALNSANANAFVVTGYTFAGWATTAHNTTKTGTVVHTDGKSVTNLTATNGATVNLYATYTANEISLANQSYTLTYSTSSQTQVITGATNGTGSYTYAITAGNASSYFSISGTTITVASSTPAGTYPLTVQATDDETAKTATATITITINKAAATISFAESSIDKIISDADFTNTLTNTGDGTVTYSSSATGVVTVNSSTGLVHIVGLGTAIITATVADGINYTYATKTVTYTVNVLSALIFTGNNAFTFAIGNGNTQGGWDGTLEYKVNSGDWTTLNKSSSGTISVDASPYKLYLRGTNNTVITGNSTTNYFKIAGSATSVACSGNIMSLLDYTDPDSATMDSYCFYYLFYYDSKLTSAPVLPATTLAQSCYAQMFYRCTGLTTAPILPATTLAQSCYNQMFNACTGLTTAPALPATTLAQSCYAQMFYNCTSLATAPALPATTMQTWCYNFMFSGCTSLTTAPSLPATTLADYCYNNMFSGCTSLTTAPSLPATTLDYSCYSQMFSNCTSLATAPVLSATTLAAQCYYSMFSGCTNLTTAPSLPATTLAGNCYQQMFSGCSNIKIIESATELTGYTLYLHHSSIASYASSMFTGCYSGSGYFRGTPKNNYYYYIDGPVVGNNCTISYTETSVSKAPSDADFINPLKNTGDGVVTYSSSNTSVATVNSSTGLVQIVGAGTAIITATVANSANCTYLVSTASYTLTVKTPVALPTASTTTYTYNGSEQTYYPANWASISSLVNISGNTRINAGSQTVTISLKNSSSYAWTDGTTTDKTLTFTINKATLPIFNFRLCNNNTGIEEVGEIPAILETEASGLQLSLDGGNTWKTCELDSDIGMSLLYDLTSTTSDIRLRVIASDTTNYNQYGEVGILPVTVVPVTFSASPQRVRPAQIDPEAQTIDDLIIYGQWQNSFTIYRILGTQLSTYIYENHLNLAHGYILAQSEAWDPSVYTCTGVSVTTGGTTTTYAIDSPFTVSASTTISAVFKNTGAISYAETTVEKVYGDADFTNPLTKTGDGTVTYSSSNTSVATVNASTGLVHIVGVGTAMITATVADGANYAYPTNTAAYVLNVMSAISFTGNNAFTFAIGNGNTQGGWDGTVEYKVNDGSWTTLNKSASGTISVSSAPYKLYLRGTGNTVITGSSGISKCFNIAGSATSVDCTGNIMTLLDYTDPDSATMGSYCFRYLFYNCAKLTSAPVLPATTLANYCYEYMFRGCTGLTSAPALPATTLEYECYDSMFLGCTSLTSAPTLPATTLATYCYYGMFSGCTSLTSAPSLPATTLASSCYRSMFSGCTSLTSAPSLPATTLASSCYAYMFSDCTSLTTAPALPATTLADDCYQNMFRGCTSLTTAPALTATTLADYCYWSMFSGCSNIKIIESSTELTGRTLLLHNYDEYYDYQDNVENMFYGCYSGSGYFTGTPQYFYYYYIDGPVVGENCTISYTQTSVSKSPSDADFINPIKNTGDGTITYSSSNTSVATVNSTTGLVHIVGVGSATITATVTDTTNCTYTTSTATYTLTVKNIGSISYQNPNLPAGYQQVEYIESHGTEWIDSGVTVAQNTNIVAEIMWNNMFYYNFMYGQWSIFANALCATNTLTVASGSTETQNIGLSATYGVKYRIVHNPSSLSLNGSTIAFGSGVNMTSSNNIFLFASGAGDTTPHKWESFGQGRIYSFKIYNGSTLVRDFIPCIRVSDGVAGLWDTVTGAFFTNQGTGNFSTSANLIANSSVSKTYGDADFTNTLTKTGDGTVTYSSSNTSVATVNSSTGLIHIVGAGSATITATVADSASYTYPTNTASYTLTVNKYSVSVPTANTTTYTYNGSEQTYYPANWSSISSYCNISGNTRTNAGSQTVTVSLKNTTNYQWSDGTTANKTFTFTIINAIVFTGNNSFTFAIGDGSTVGGWNGTLQYKINDGSWTTLNRSGSGTISVSSAPYKLYLRGTGNTVINNENSSTKRFNIGGSATSVDCTGNIMTLLNYSNPSSATMGNYCFAYLFSSCTKLTSAPTLPATTLAMSCYQAMFSNCTSLTTAPALPATTLTDYCYFCMFQGCTSLTTAPSLPATTLASGCYSHMFNNCSSLKVKEYTSTQTSSNLTLCLRRNNTNNSYFNNMFKGCYSGTGYFSAQYPVNTRYYYIEIS